MEKVLLHIDTSKEEIREVLRIMFEAQKMNFEDINIKNCGDLTWTVLNIAREGDIRLNRDFELMKYLAKLEAMNAVPRKLYPAVAEVFAKIYRTTEESRKIN